jgi:hypothetical protein
LKSRRSASIPKRMASIETKCLNMMAKNRKPGVHDKFDTLIFNTYYNTLVGNKKVNLGTIPGTATTGFNSPTRNFKLKKVKWADQDNQNSANLKTLDQSQSHDRVNTAPPSGLLKLSQLFYGNVAKFKVIFVVRVF